MYCATNHFLELNFLVPHNKPHGVHGLGKHHHMRFDTTLGHGTCEIRHTPCAFTLFNSILDQTWVPGIPEQQQNRYQPVKYCTYWPVLGYFNK